MIHGDGVKRNEKLHKRYINDPSEKAKAGVTIFFSFLFFSFLFVLLFLFFSFLFFLFKKFFEVGQGEGSRFFSSGTALNLGGGQGEFRNEIGKVPDRLFGSCGSFFDQPRESSGSALRVLWEFADA